MRTRTFLSGVAAGAALMYLLDPERGRRRRALLRDQLAHGAHELEQAGEWLDARSRDLRNRAHGMVAESRARLHPDEVDDRVLEARVRSALGRAVAHPHDVHVAAQDGLVTASGKLLPADVGRVLTVIRSVRGVRDVDDQLRARAHSAGVPELQVLPN